MSKKITDMDIEKAEVKLKPFMGVEPGIYLAVIYGSALFLLLFLILILPGIRNNGSRLTVITKPGNSAVYVDDIYMGADGDAVFVARGEHVIRIEKDYFDTVEFDLTVGGRVLGSLLFPGKVKLERNLTISDPELFLKSRFSLISSYGLINEFYDRYQLPPLISQTVRDFREGSASEDTLLLEKFLKALRSNLSSPDMLIEYARGLAEYKDIGYPDSNDISGVIEFVLTEAPETDLSLYLSILRAFPETERGQVLSIMEKHGIEKKLAEYAGKISSFIEDNSRSVPDGTSLEINGKEFTGFSGGIVISGDLSLISGSQVLTDNVLEAFPHTEEVEDFLIMSREVTRGDYQEFMEENPMWSPENTDTLMGKGLVTEDYLTGVDFADSELPVSNISWYAAEAYCKWLQTKLPDSLSEYEVRLPSEAEWTAAAVYASDAGYNIFKDTSEGISAVDFTRISSSGTYDMLGSLWEWCDNWYFPADLTNAGYGVSSGFPGSEKAVRGGSWANNSYEINTDVRGSQDPSWCTPFLGFRPVAVRENQNE